MTMKNHLLLNETVMWLATGWNTQSYLKLSDYQSAPPVLEDENKQTNKKRCVKLHILSKENKTSTELLLGIYLTKLNKEEEEEEGSGAASSRLGQREEAPHPVALSPFPFLLQGQSLSVTDCHADWAYLDFFFSQYSDPTPTPSVPLHLPHTLHLSPMVLSFQLTKHLT